MAGQIQLNGAWLLLVVFCVTGLVSWVAVGRLIHYLRAKNMVDVPNERTMHTGVVPRGGGLIVVGLIIAALVGLALFYNGRALFFIGLAVCVSAWAGLSWCDDRFDLSPTLRFGVQLLISAATIVSFGWVNQVQGLALGWLGPVVSLIGIVWMANLNNFMDGMDGLAASQAIMAGLTLGVWFVFLGDHALALLCAVLVAASYGFLLWNWQPAKIFMGDVGSVSLGALYATLIIITSNRYGIPVISVIMVFGVFIGDATYTVLNRIRKREPFWLPHRSHFYQRAGLAGVAHSHVVISAIVLMGLCSVFATLSILYRDIMLPLAGGLVLLLASAAFWVTRIEKTASNKP